MFLGLLGSPSRTDGSFEKAIDMDYDISGFNACYRRFG